MKRVATVWALVMLVAVTAGCSTRKALLLTQYPSGSARVEDMKNAIVNRFDSENISYYLTIFNMDTAGHRAESWRKDMAHMAMMRVETYDPDAVFLAGDDVAALLGERLVNKQWRVVFLDVKGNPADYLLAAKLNVTGVRERVPVRETFDLIKRLVPGAERVAVVADESYEGNAVVAQIAEVSYPGLKVVAVKRASILDEWLAAVRSVQEKADVLMVGPCHHVRREAQGERNMAPEDVLRLTAKANRLPDFGFSKEAAEPGALMAAVTVPAAAQADLAAEMALRVMLYGADVSAIRATECKMRRTVVNLNRAREFHIAVPASLMEPGPEVRPRKRNLWERFLGLFRREHRPQELRIEDEEEPAKP